MHKTLWNTKYNMFLNRQEHASHTNKMLWLCAKLWCYINVIMWTNITNRLSMKICHSLNSNLQPCDKCTIHTITHFNHKIMSEHLHLITIHDHHKTSLRSWSKPFKFLWILTYFECKNIGFSSYSDHDADAKTIKKTMFFFNISVQKHWFL